jgi:hypothetical protein
MKKTTNISNTIHSRMRGKRYMFYTCMIASFLSLDFGKMGPSPKTRTNWHPEASAIIHVSTAP